MQANLDAIRAKDKQLKVDAEKLKAAAATEDRMHVSFGAAALLAGAYTSPWLWPLAVMAPLAAAELHQTAHSSSSQTAHPGGRSHHLGDSTRLGMGGQACQGVLSGHFSCISQQPRFSCSCMQIGEQVVAHVGGMARVPSASLAFMPLLTPYCLCFAAQGLEGELAAAKKHLEQAQAEMRTLNQVSCAPSKQCCLGVPMLKSMGKPERMPTISKHVQPLDPWYGNSSYMRQHVDSMHPFTPH